MLTHKLMSPERHGVRSLATSTTNAVVCALTNAKSVLATIIHQKTIQIPTTANSWVNYLVACTRLYKPLCRSVGLSICLSLNARSTRLMAIGLVFIRTCNFNLSARELEWLNAGACIFKCVRVHFIECVSACARFYMSGCVCLWVRLNALRF